MKLSIILLGLGISLAAPVIAPLESVVMAQDYDVTAKDFSTGLQKFLNGMSTLYYGETFNVTNGDLEPLSYSHGSFQNASDMFFRVTMSDPNYKSGRAMEMYLLSKVALNQDITQDVEELMESREFKYKTKLKDFFVDILNGKHIEINFLSKKNPNIKKTIDAGNDYDGDFAIYRRGELLQTLYAVDKSKLHKLKQFGPHEVIRIAEAYRVDGDSQIGLNILLRYADKWKNDHWIPFMAGTQYFTLGDVHNAIKYEKIALERAPPEEKDYIQGFINVYKKKLPK